MILNRNPLADITATTAIRGVVMRGRYRDRDALDALLRDAADEVTRMPAGGRRPL